MNTAVSFDSELFQPFLPDECQVNPGRYGAELCYWLSRKLAEHRIYTSYPNFEDWGWFIEYVSEDGGEFWLCCSNIEGSATKWLCKLVPKAKGFLGRHKPDIEIARPFLDALEIVLRNELNLTNVEWSV